jgi:AbiV family abortive infection protein
MTLPEIIEARRKILSNAEELIEEAEILFAHKKYPRAFALAHLACEELAKLPMLNTAVLNLLIGEKNDWREINRRLVSHTEKLRMSEGMDYMWDEVHPGDSDVHQYEKGLRAIPEFNSFKNGSLYSGFFHHAFVQPSELIEESLSENMVRLANSRLIRYREHERVFHRLAVSEEGKKQMADSWRSYRKIERVTKGKKK